MQQKRTLIENEFNNHLTVTKATMESTIESLVIASTACIDSLNQGGKIIICGNGGSAGDAQHIAAELVGRYKNERKGLAAIALTTDSSIITSIGNDYGYESIFDRQVGAIANEGDVVIGISTGGSSVNVIKALKLAKELKCNTIGFSGKKGGAFNDLCDINIVASSNETARIQEMHILFGHIICQLIDLEF